MTIRSAVFLFACLAGCDSPKSDPPKADDPKGDDSREGKDSKQSPPEQTATAESCMPKGLETAKPVEVVVLPRECGFAAAGTITAPTVVRTADEYTAALQCPAGVEPPTIDFGKHQLQLASYMLSPAYAGSQIVDDGKLITFVQRDRSPCPDDPLPMPIPGSVAYLLPQGAERTYQQTACSLAARCE